MNQEVKTINGYSVKDEKAVRTYDTVALMKADRKLKQGQHVKTRGYYNINDGGSAEYYITNTSSNSVYQENLENGLYATLININNVYIEQFGAKGDGTTDDSNAFSIATKYSNLNLSENKTYMLNQVIEIENDIIINGNNSTIKGNGLNTTENLTIKNLNFRDINTNAIEINGIKKLIVNNCKFENIGISETLVPNYQGMGVYSINTDVDISNSYFKNCNGHGCIFVTPPCYLIINNNIFEDNFYRAISIYSGSNENQATGKIYNNKINNSGYTNTTNSGVGCNGIYGSNGQHVEVFDNYITNSVENGIEGNFYSIHDNYINGTGIDYEHKPTPSTEGIYTAASVESFIYNNIIKNSKTSGIYSYGSGNIANKYIFNNQIETDDNNAIYLNSSTSVKNSEIKNNITNKQIMINNGSQNKDEMVKFIGDSTNLKGHATTLLHYGNTRNVTKYFNNIGDFTASNVTPTFPTDATLGVTVMELVHQQYAKVLSPVFTLPTKARIEVEIFAKGNFNVNLYKNGAYSSSLLGITSNNSYNVFRTDINLLTNTLGNTYNLTIEPRSGETIDVAYIIYNIYEA